MATAVPGVQGAVLLTREGVFVMAHGSSLREPKLFSAMTAAMFGAASTLLSQIDRPNQFHIMVDDRQLLLVTLPVSARLLLTLIASPSWAVDSGFAELQPALARLEQAVATLA